jgi:hypothetical protein
MARGWGRVFVVAALLLGGGGTAQAQQTPAERAREAAAMLTAAGFQIRGAQIVNACGRPVQPRPTAVDLNGDGKPEAVVADVDPQCYGGTGEAFSIIQRRGPANWGLVGAGRGRIKLLETRTGGWRDYSLEGPGCQRTWTYQGEPGYVSVKGCPGEDGARPATAPAPPPLAGGAAGNPADRAAAFRAAGFTPTRGKYLACDKSQELEIEVRDLNGDGRPDAVITDSGTECFGNTGTGYTLVTKDASGAWRKLFENQGVPDFQTTRGVGGWPDIVNGGPGFCFPVLRWNGSDYAIVRWKAENPGACAGRR